MMVISDSEITQEKVGTEAQKERIRRIINYQQSLYWSSSSSSSLSSAPASCSSFSSSRKSSSLLQLMKGGSTSLRRLFDMEHTSLATHFDNYSGSPIIKPIYLWGSGREGEFQDPWADINPIGSANEPASTDAETKFGSDGNFEDGEFGVRDMKGRRSIRKLTRKKSFRRLPGFGLWRCRGFRFRLKLRRLRIMICGRKF